MMNYKKHFEEGNMNGVTNEDEVKKILEFRKLRKSIWNNFRGRLLEQSMDRERIESLLEVVYATTSKTVEEVYQEAKEELKENSNVEVLYDKDVMNLIKWMEWIPNRAIESNFGSLWSKNHLIAGENGEGILIVGCLSC